MVRPPKKPSKIEEKTMKKLLWKHDRKKHENNMKNGITMESQNMKNLENNLRNSTLKKGEELKKSPRARSMQSEVVPRGLQLSKKDKSYQQKT